MPYDGMYPFLCHEIGNKPRKNATVSNSFFSKAFRSFVNKKTSLESSWTCIKRQITIEKWSMLGALLNLNCLKNTLKKYRLTLLKMKKSYIENMNN